MGLAIQTDYKLAKKKKKSITSCKCSKCPHDLSILHDTLRKTSVNAYGLKTKQN